MQEHMTDKDISVMKAAIARGATKEETFQLLAKEEIAQPTLERWYNKLSKPAAEEPKAASVSHKKGKVVITDAELEALTKP